MKVKDLMSTSIVSAGPETSLKQIAKQMRQSDVGSIPICDDGDKILGIITDRDIVVRALSSDIEDVNAKDIMTQYPVSATLNMNIHQVALLMAKNQIRRLPVVDDERLIGFISMADFARKKIYIDEAGDALSAISRPSTLH